MDVEESSEVVEDDKRTGVAGPAARALLPEASNV